jgi:hypothetical protein
LGTKNLKMIIKNKLDKTFGSQMAFSGWILLAFGAIFIFDVMGIILVIIGFLLATTVDGVCIDSQNHRLKRFSGPFGFSVIGRWENFDDYSGMTVIPWKRKLTTWSRSNRQNNVTEEDFRIFLVGHDRKPVFAIKKCTSRHQAIEEMDKLAELLHWTVWTTEEK